MKRLSPSDRTATLAAMQRNISGREEEASNDALAGHLTWPRDVLAAYASILAGRGLAIAHVYAAAAVVSVDRAISAIAAAEEQEGWPKIDLDDFTASNLADWL
jgi:hypothetical protein